MMRGPITDQPRFNGARVSADTVRAAYRGLRAVGLSEVEASNLSAHLAGLGRTRQGWRLVEVERLLFIQSLVASDRIQH
jgi:hypothetical protein